PTTRKAARRRACKGAGALEFHRTGVPIERDGIDMRGESLAGFAAATALSLSLMLTPAGPAFAGVSGFSVTSATFVPGNNKQVLYDVHADSEHFVAWARHGQQQGTMVALARGEFRGPCGSADSWQVTANSPDTMQAGLASMLAGARICTPSPFGIRPTGPCKFAHTDQALIPHSPDGAQIRRGLKTIQLL